MTHGTSLDKFRTIIEELYDKKVFVTCYVVKNEKWKRDSYEQVTIKLVLWLCKVKKKDEDKNMSKIYELAKKNQGKQAELSQKMILTRIIILMAI